MMLRFPWLYCAFAVIAAFIVSISPVLAEPLQMDTARAAMRQQDWEAANYEWRRVLEQDPQNMEAMAGLGESLYHTGFSQEAVALLESVPAKKRSIAAELTLARVYAALPDDLHSRDAYLRILNRMPFHLAAFRELREMSVRLSPQDQQPARRKLDEAARAARVRGEKSALAGRFVEAASYFEMCAAQFHTVGLYNDYGLLLLLSGQYQKASEQYALLRVKGKLYFAEVNSNAAIVSLSLGNTAQAKAEILEAIRQSRSDKRKAQLYNNYGYILEMSRKRHEARFAYEHALSLDPTLLMAHFNLAFVQQAEQEYSSAIESYRNILKMDPNNAEAWTHLGLVHELQYHSRPALAAYRKAIAANPKYPDAYRYLAALYTKMGRPREAHEAEQQLMELSFQKQEAPSDKSAAHTLPQKNPLKYVALFSSNPKILVDSIQKAE